MADNARNAVAETETGETRSREIKPIFCCSTSVRSGLTEKRKSRMRLPPLSITMRTESWKSRERNVRARSRDDTQKSRKGRRCQAPGQVRRVPHPPTPLTRGKWALSIFRCHGVGLHWPSANVSGQEQPDIEGGAAALMQRVPPIRLGKSLHAFVPSSFRLWHEPGMHCLVLGC